MRLQGCNDAGCGPEATGTVDVALAAPSFSVAPTLDAEGKVRPRTFNASWDPMPGATSYTLGWRRTGEDSQPQGQSDDARQSRAAANSPAQDRSANAVREASGDGSQGANDQEENQLTVAGDQTSAEFTVAGDGKWRVELRGNGDSGPVGQVENQMEVKSYRPGHLVIVSSGSFCPASDVNPNAADPVSGGLEVRWDGGANANAVYHYQVLTTRLYPEPGGWIYLPVGGDDSSYTFTGLQNGQIYTIWVNAAMGRKSCAWWVAHVTPSDPALGPPTSFSASVLPETSGAVKLTWDDPGDASISYDIEYSRRLFSRLGSWYEYDLPAWHSISADSAPTSANGKITSTVSLACGWNYIYNLRVRAGRDGAVGPHSRKQRIATVTNNTKKSNMLGIWGTADDDTLDGGDGDDCIYGRAGNDTLNGRGGNDTLQGDGGNDALNGDDGSDTIVYYWSPAGVNVNLATGVVSGGHAQGDTIDSIENVIGSVHDDVITGNASDNYFIGYDGADTLDGGSGSDTVDYSESSDEVSIDLITGNASGGHASGDTLTSIENVVGSPYSDTIIGNASDNILKGGVFWDTLHGNGGNDTLYGGDNGDVIYGGGGGDTVYGGGGADSVFGGDGADTAYGDFGNDKLHGQFGNDFLHGGDSNDTLYGGHGNDTLHGDDHHDVLDGGPGVDTLHGDSGNDTLNGGDHHDTLYGGDGNDKLKGGPGRDHLDGGDGSDAADYSGSNAAVTVNLATGSVRGGHATGDTIANIENAFGSGHSDTLTGNASANVLRGRGGRDTLNAGAGNDELHGGNGNDTLNGGEGDDRLFGGAGNDALNGGGGSDVFHFRRNFGADTISGYTLGATKDASEKVYLCLGPLSNPPTHSGADSGSDHVITVTYNGTTAGTITLKGVTTKSANFANLNVLVIPVSEGGSCRIADAGNGDETAPVLLAVAANGTTVSLTFSEPLEEDSVPLASAFTVQRTPQGGAEETVALSGTPDIGGGAVVLNLADPVLVTDTGVKVSYSKPASAEANRLRDRTGNEVESFTDQTADPIDTTQPRLVRGEIDGNTITLYFSEALDEDSVGGFYRVTLWGGSKGGGFLFTAKGPVKVSGNKVTVGLGNRRSNPGEYASVRYQKYNDPAIPRLRDLAGNEVRTPGIWNTRPSTWALELENFSSN